MFLYHTKELQTIRDDVFKIFIWICEMCFITSATARCKWSPGVQNCGFSRCISIQNCHTVLEALKQCCKVLDWKPVLICWRQESQVLPEKNLISYLSAPWTTMFKRTLARLSDETIIGSRIFCNQSQLCFSFYYLVLNGNSTFISISSVR